MTDFTIAPLFAERGLTARLGILRASMVVSASPAALAMELAGTAEALRSHLGDRPASSLPAITATRAAYKALGKDPSRYRPAAEALARRALRSLDMPAINSVVDIGNIVSLETGISIGVYDASKIRGDVTLRRGDTSETYDGIGRGPVNLEGLPLLADGTGSFGCPTSDSERTMVDLKSAHVLMVLYGFEEDSVALTTGLERATDLMNRHCDASDIERDMIEKSK